MSIFAELPDGRRLAFPDDTDPAVMDAVVKRELGVLSVGEDVARSAAYAVPKAITGLAGLPGTIRDAIEPSRKALTAKLPPEAQRVDRALGALNPFNALASALPSGSDLQRMAERSTGKWHEPQTRAGKITDTALQTAATMGRNLFTAPLRAGAVVAGTTAGTEGAGAASGDHPLLRFLGGVVGGGIPAATNAMKSRQGVVIRDMIGDLSEGDITRGLALQDRARAAGVPLLGTESLDSGHQLASAVLASPTGGKTIADFVKGRAGQTRTAVERDLIAPTGPRATPGENAARAQKAAEGVIAGAERSRSAAVKPLYDTAEQTSIPTEALANVELRVRELQARYAPNTPEFKVFDDFLVQLRDTEGAPVTNVGMLDRIYGSTRDAGEVSLINATSADKRAARPNADAAKALDEALRANSSELAQGRDLYRRITEDVIEPLRASPVGVVAGKSGFDPAAPSAVQRVVGQVTDARLARPATIRELAQQLNAQDRQAFPGIVQTHLENQLNAAAGDLRSGPNAAAGSRFRQAVAGTPQDAANFDEMMRGVAAAHGRKPEEVVRGARNLLEILERTGRTPGMGSQTHPRGEIARELGKTKTGDALEMISAAPLSSLRRRLSDWTLRARYDELARVLTAPDSVEQVVRLGKYKLNTLTANYLASQLLGLQRAVETGER